MSIIVTGASGKLGRLVAEHLMVRLAPKELVLVTRRPAALSELATKVFQAQFDDPDQLRLAEWTEHDDVIHAIQELGLEVS